MTRPTLPELCARAAELHREIAALLRDGAVECSTLAASESMRACAAAHESLAFSFDIDAKGPPQ